MENDNCYVFHTIVKDRKKEPSVGRGCDYVSKDNWRRQCGCIRTSEKLKQILQKFPSPPPPSPKVTSHGNAVNFDSTCISAYCTQMHNGPLNSGNVNEFELDRSNEPLEAVTKAGPSKSWQLIVELVQLVQLSVTATALAIYYLIYCYMQIIYYTLRSALYFHNADGPMKITIGVVTLTSLVIGINLLLRMERLIGL